MKAPPTHNEAMSNEEVLKREAELENAQDALQEALRAPASTAALVPSVAKATTAHLLPY
jgi:hypothetical protein